MSNSFPFFLNIPNCLFETEFITIIFTNNIFFIISISLLCLSLIKFKFLSWVANRNEKADIDIHSFGLGIILSLYKL